MQPSRHQLPIFKSHYCHDLFCDVHPAILEKYAKIIFTVLSYLISSTTKLDAVEGNKLLRGHSPICYKIMAQHRRQAVINSAMKHHMGCNSNYWVVVHCLVSVLCCRNYPTFCYFLVSSFRACLVSF